MLWRGGFRMTVPDLEERLKMIREQGYGDIEIQAWDPDSEKWESVTGFTYASGLAR